VKIILKQKMERNNPGRQMLEVNRKVEINETHEENIEEVGWGQTLGNQATFVPAIINQEVEVFTSVRLIMV